MFARKVEVFFAVNLAPQSDLQSPSLFDQAFFNGVLHRSAVGVRAAEVAAPGIAVSVELHEGDGAVMLMNRAQDGKQNGVIAADTYWTGSSAQHGIELLGDALVSVFNRERVDGEVAEIGDAPSLKWINFEHRIPWPNHRRLHADVARPEAWAGTIGCATVKRHSDQRDIKLFR